ncbi:T9SS type A sorting domain-containing protein, partial [Lentimicrobium sp.]
PNPSKGIIRIELEKGGYELIISSPAGREILKQPFIRETTLDLSSLNNGLYFLIINDISGKRVSAKKILKL